MQNSLISKVANDHRVYGTLLTSTSPHMPPVVSSLGLDFVFIDTEHICIDREKLSWMCRTYSAMGIVPIVRIPSPDPYLASMALDGGAVGILAPYIETVEQVKALCGAVKRKPLKGQRLTEILNGKPVSENTENYLRNYAQDRLLLINIESQPALDNLPELLNVSGLDGIIVGPHDLSVSLDVPEQYHDEKFLRTLQKIIDTSRATLPITGVHFMDAGDTQDMGNWMKMGFNLLIAHADLVYLKRGLSQELSAMRDLFGEQSKDDGKSIHV